MRRLLAAGLCALLSSCASVHGESLRDALSDDPAGGHIAIRPVAAGAWVISQEKPRPANALLVQLGPEQLVLVDTLWTPRAMSELMWWVEQTMPGRRVLAINTHFHVDRTGGNRSLLRRKIPVYASDATVRLMKERGRKTIETLAAAIEDSAEREAFLALDPKPADGTFPLEKGLDVAFAGEKVQVRFPGPGHAPDNVVVYFPSKKLLFGGCLLLGQGRVGNTSDADMSAWSRSVSTLKQFPSDVVVPGHGAPGDAGLIDKTIQLLDAAGKAAR